MPQIVVGTLIRQLRIDDSGFSSVEGTTESVFGTSTTSKKPADVWELNAEGTIGALYEITAKPVDKKLLDDCVDSLASHHVKNPLVKFICRFPDDVRG